MLFEPIFKHAQSQPQATAIIDDNGQYTWQQLAAMTAGLSLYLAAQTDKPRVCLFLPAGAGFVASFYATLLAGKAVVPINFLLSEREVAHCIADSGIDTLVTIPFFAERLKNLPLKVVDLTQLPKAPPAAITPKFPSPAPDDVAVIMYTSGTSGLPKGVMLSYGNLQSDVDAAIEHAQLKGVHNFLGIIPLFHSTGMMATMIAPMQLGSRTVYMARFSPTGVAKAIKEHQISVMAAVPSMYGAMLRLKETGPADVASLYAPLSGGEPLPEAVREGFATKFHKPLMEGYGLTEVCGPICVNVPQAHKPGSVGKLLPGVTARFVGDNGRDAPHGEPGELWLKGPMVMKGYLNRPEDSAQVLTPDGFFKTGDVARMDEEGFLFITGRIKELIIIAGEKAVPREIEDVLMRHPAVADVAVVGRKDPSRGEAVVAFVVVREGHELKPETLRSFAIDLGLPAWKAPRDVHIVDDLPRSPTGKVLKRVLADQVAQQG